jgi:DNA-binding GntR family transcriptional regulator
MAADSPYGGIASSYAVPDFGLEPGAYRPRPAPDRRLTHCEQVRTAIEDDIFTGRRAPGAPLDEDEIARQFKVSRTPVREAMLQLIQTGLVEKTSRKRPIVAPLNIRRLIQMFETLSEFEGICARLAARRITARERAALVEGHEAAERALQAGNENQYMWLARRFHAQVWSATHNEVLLDSARKLSIRLIPYRMFQARSKGRPDANNEDHRAILAALLQGDGDLAYSLMRAHVTVQGDILAEYISVTGQRD